MSVPARAGIGDENRPLTKLQREFIEEYLKRKFDVCAAGRATYTKNPKSAHRWAWDTFKLPHVQAEIRKRVEEKLHDAGFNKESVVMEWLKMARSDIGDFITWDIIRDEQTDTYHPTIRVKSSSEVDTSVIKSVKIGRTGKLEFEMYDKQQALKQLGEIMGIYPKATNTLEITGKNGDAIKIEDVRTKLLERLNKAGGGSQPNDSGTEESISEQPK